MAEGKLKRGGQPGNKNGAGRGPIIRMARIAERISREEDYKRIVAGINAQLDKFAEGDTKSGEFVRDTTDGKPTQQVIGAGADGAHLLDAKIEIVIVDAKA